MHFYKMEPTTIIDDIKQRDNEIQTLKERIEQLNEELKTATAEKIQSAQYGLVLLVWKHHYWIDIIIIDWLILFSLFNHI